MYDELLMSSHTRHRNANGYSNYEVYIQDVDSN